MKLKGQIFGIDMLVAIVMFYVLFNFISTAQQDVRSSQPEFEQASLKARVASSILLTSSGEPSGWTPTNVTALGIAEKRGVIDAGKLSMFLNLSSTSPPTVTELLGLAGYNFYFNLTYVNGTVVSVAGQYFNGSALAGADFNATYTATATTTTLINKTIVKMQVKVGTE